MSRCRQRTKRASSASTNTRGIESISESIALAQQITDEFYRDSALHFLINLLMVAREEKLAKDLYKVIEVDLIREAILKDHPQLAAKF